MTKNSLKKLCEKHSGKVSDKWSSYIVEYERILGDYRDQPVTLLEIGVQNGGSLEIWSKFFVNASKFVGCDINPDCAKLNYEDPRIVVIVGDANSHEVQLKVLQHAPSFDVIIDDGSHCSSDIVKSFAAYFPHLSDGGIFVVEDLHCSYWEEFEGGLFDPYSSINFFKRLVDVINHEHWGVSKLRIDILRGFFLKYDCQVDENLLAQIHSIEFINSICVIKKESSLNNALGTRFILGLNKASDAELVNSHSNLSMAPSQVTNAWAVRAIAPDEDVMRLENELRLLNKSLAERDVTIVALNKILSERDETIAELYSSTSWRFTKPLRVVQHHFKKNSRT